MQRFSCLSSGSFATGGRRSTAARVRDRRRHFPHTRGVFATAGEPGGLKTRVLRLLARRRGGTERTDGVVARKREGRWLPTGTLANHLAVRLLAGSRRRVLVQAQSHLFNDCGDCAQTLSGLHLVPSRLDARRSLWKMWSEPRPTRRRDAWRLRSALSRLKRRCGGGAESACTARPVREYAALSDTGVRITL